MTKVLIVAAHPDDEVVGAGGTICKHVDNGDEVYVCIVTKAYEPQWTKEYIDQKVEEQKAVDELLGIKKRFNLDMPTVKLNTIPAGEFNSTISRVFTEVSPDIVYTHFEHDLNYDHTLVYHACMVAARPPDRIKLLCYDVSETAWCKKPFIPDTYVDITGYVDNKIKAFECYKSEVKKYPHPRSPEGIIIKAQQRGMEASMCRAEAFVQIRSYWL